MRLLLIIVGCFFFIAMPAYAQTGITGLTSNQGGEVTIEGSDLDTLSSLTLTRLDGKVQTYLHLSSFGGEATFLPDRVTVSDASFLAGQNVTEVQMNKEVSYHLDPVLYVQPLITNIQFQDPDVVVITGSGFAGITTLGFHTTDSELQFHPVNTKIWSDTQIVLRSPAFAGHDLIGLYAQGILPTFGSQDIPWRLSFPSHILSVIHDDKDLVVQTDNAHLATSFLVVCQDGQTILFAHHEERTNTRLANIPCQVDKVAIYRGLQLISSLNT